MTSQTRSWAGWARLWGASSPEMLGTHAPVSPNCCPQNSPVHSASCGPFAPASEGQKDEVLARARGAFAPRREVHAPSGSICEGAAATSGLFASFVQQGVWATAPVTAHSR